MKTSLTTIVGLLIVVGVLLTHSACKKTPPQPKKMNLFWRWDDQIAIAPFDPTFQYEYDTRRGKLRGGPIVFDAIPQKTFLIDLDWSRDKAQGMVQWSQKVCQIITLGPGSSNYKGLSFPHGFSGSCKDPDETVHSFAIGID